MIRNPLPFPEGSGEPPDPRPARPRFRWTRRRLFSVLFLSLLLLSGLIGGWSAVHVIFGTQAASTPPKMTLQQFLRQGNPYHASTGPHVLPHGSQALSFGKTSSQTTPPVQPLPSAAPPTIAPVSQTLSSAFLAAPVDSTSVAPVHLAGKDTHGTRIEVIVPAGAINLAHATAAGAAPQGTLTLTLTELHGHFVAGTAMLGTFQVQITDAQHHVLQGVLLNRPITLTYHYTAHELYNLDMNPTSLFLVWTDRIAAQTAAKQATTGDVIPMQNDATSSTLTVQSSVIDAGTFALGASTPENLSPPTPLLASESGNSGQVSFAYPLTVAPGPSGTTPDLQMTYSSGDTNARHAANSPANNVGEGWSLSLGAITAMKMPDGTLRYSISDVDHISDRLIPDGSGTNFATEHLSYMKITQVTVNGQPCFHVWDPSGNYYEFGCTTDSLEYYIDSSNTRTNYAWNLDTFIPANEGPGTDSRRMTVSYVQDIESINGQNSIRDAAIKQIVYGAGQTAGTVDFSYKGPTANSPWVTAYGTNEGGCTPPDGLTTTQRCDDPLNKSGGLPDPTVMSTLSLETVNTYVGNDSSPSHLDYSYNYSYQDTPFYDCNDPATLSPEYCAGNHLLQSITPTVYQNGTGHQLPDITFSYSSSGYQNSYTDTTQTVGGSAFKATNSWRYLTAYHDHSDGVGETFQYHTAWNNSNGTPITSSGDNRYDALFCDWNPSDCQQSPFAPTNQKMWTEQVVTAITSTGKDSSSSSLSPATTSYDYWLQKTNGTCAADSSGDSDCVGFGYIPNGNSGWADYYDGEFTGFGTVLITSPSGDLTVQKYASTEGWQSPATDVQNYTAGQLYETDVYSGQYINGSKLIQQTDYIYAGTNGTHTSCSTTFSTVSYTACEVVLLSKKTTDYEQAGSGNTNAPWTQKAYTYDDYTSSAGLGDYHQSPATGSYHNLQQEVMTSSNAPTETQQWTYDTTNTTVGSTVYYDVNKVAHSDLVDANNHTWQCEDYSYDAGVASGVPTPAAGWVTTATSYSTCGNSSTAIANYTGYDNNGNTVATVDGLGAANPSLYSTEGCTLSTAPAFFPTSSWSSTHYTTCAAFDPTSGLQTDSWNAFSQHSSTSYDATQGLLPTSTTDVNSQATNKAYSYDSNGNETVRVTNPAETGSYTSQSTMVSTCTDSSTYPCMQIDSNTSLYPNAGTRTFYDSQGRAVETLTPGPDSTHTTVQFTVYNDQTHAVFTSVPFVVNSTTSWIDPNGAVDDQGNTPGGTATTLDPLGRTLTTTDPAGAVTTMVYGVNTSGVSGDTNTYATTTAIDANNHVQVSYDDALGRTIYAVTDSGVNGGTLTPIKRVTSQYNVLNTPTSVTVTDLAPHSGQTITSVTTTATYDDLGRMLTLTDPDRGTHTYTYDADGQVINDVSGTRTIGYNYDLLGRLGCTNDAATVINATGACTSGSHPYVQNTYDTNELGTQGTDDFPIGHLTQSVATTYFPEGTSATTTEQMQYDARGRTTTQTMLIATPSAWNVTTALPTYQMTQSYNDANQPVTTQTSMGSSQGYTATDIYDSTTGTAIGLSNQANATSANLVTATYDNHAQLSALNLLASDGSALASDSFTYDNNLRPIGTTALWQSGSGQSGTLFSQTTSYDAVGNVVSQATNQAAANGVSGSGGSEVENFCYNEQSELVWAGNGGTQPAAGNGTCGSGTLSNSITGAGYSNSYAYTNLGQLWQGPLNGTGSYQYLYCSSSQPHQLTGLYASGSTCSSKSGQVYGGSYDAWGNQTSRTYNSSTATLSYDLLDHLVEWNAGSNSQEWTVYDAAGNRVLTRATGSSGTTITTYPFGTEEHQYSSSGTPTANATYYYSLAGKLIGALLGTTMQFFLTDDLGSVRTAISNTAGSATVVGYMGYGPFGFLQYHAGQTGTNKGYTGQYNDPLSGLDYYVARYYDPVVGLFLSADMVQSNLLGFNPYAYVGENPETLTDPTGKFFSCGLYCGGGFAPRPLSPPSSSQGNPPTNHPIFGCGLPCASGSVGGGTTGGSTGGGFALRLLPLPSASGRHPANSSACANSPWGCVENWNTLLGGAGLVFLGSGIMLAAMLNFTNPVMAFVQVAARMILKNALNGVVWMIGTGIRMVMSSFSNVPIIAKVITDTALVILDGIAVVNNLVNIFNFFKTVAAVGTIGAGIAKLVSAGQTLMNDGPNAVGPLMMKNLNLFGSLSAINVIGVGQLIYDSSTLFSDWATLNSQQ